MLWFSHKLALSTASRAKHKAPRQTNNRGALLLSFTSADLSHQHPHTVAPTLRAHSLLVRNGIVGHDPSVVPRSLSNRARSTSNAPCVTANA